MIPIVLYLFTRSKSNDFKGFAAQMQGEITVHKKREALGFTLFFKKPAMLTIIESNLMVSNDQMVLWHRS